MGWVGPAIQGAIAVGGFIKNKIDEKHAAKRAKKHQDNYYSSPVMQALNAYLRDYWTKNNLGERAPGINIDDLLRPPRFDSDEYRQPGAGSALGKGLFDALASYYGGKLGGTKTGSVPSFGTAGQW